jgi:hypothetical protein
MFGRLFAKEMATLGFGVSFSKLKWVEESFDFIHHADSIA